MTHNETFPGTKLPIANPDASPIIREEALSITAALSRVGGKTQPPRSANSPLLRERGRG